MIVSNDLKILKQNVQWPCGRFYDIKLFADSGGQPLHIVGHRQWKLLFIKTIKKDNSKLMGQK